MNLSARVRENSEFDLLFSPFKSAAQYIIDAAVKGRLHTFESPVRLRRVQGDPGQTLEQFVRRPQSAFCVWTLHPRKAPCRRRSAWHTCNLCQFEASAAPFEARGAVQRNDQFDDRIHDDGLSTARLSGPQNATKAVYKAHGIETFGILKGQFEGCWQKAAREVKNPKGRWGKSGTRTSSEEIK